MPGDAQASAGAHLGVRPARSPARVPAASARAGTPDVTGTARTRDDGGMSAPQQSDGDPARDATTPRAVITDGLPSQLLDTDPDETQEWVDSLDAVVDHAGR